MRRKECICYLRCITNEPKSWWLVKHQLSHSFCVSGICGCLGGVLGLRASHRLQSRGLTAVTPRGSGEGSRCKLTHGVADRIQFLVCCSTEGFNSALAISLQFLASQASPPGSSQAGSWLPQSEQEREQEGWGGGGGMEEPDFHSEVIEASAKLWPYLLVKNKSLGPAHAQEV